MSSPPLPAAAAFARAQIESALAQARGGRLHDAIATLRGVCTEQPAHAGARCLLGVMLQEAGDHEAALRELDSGIAATPGDASLHETRAGILLALQRFAAAEGTARRALRLDAQRPRALSSLALALDAQQRSADAIPVLCGLLALQPGQGVARRLLARSLLAVGDAHAALRTVLHPAVLEDAALARDVAGDFGARAPLAQTLALLDALLQRHAQDPALVLRMARTLHQAGRSSDALCWSERAHALAPHALEPVEMRAVSLIDRGDVDAGIACYHALLARADAGAETASRFLILLHYDPAQDNEALFAAHAGWTRRYVQRFGAPFAATHARDPQRRLRIGWLSPRFSDGPVATFFTGLLGAFDHTAFEHCLVALRAHDDGTAARLRPLAHAWLELHGLDDEALLQRLRAAAFDVVIDLAGHSFGNRLGVLAQRVAPIQLCWLDYFDTTAIAAMDGWISDAWLTPPDSPQRYTERVLRLSAGRFCYTPPVQAPEPERVGAGAPVFASFNRLAKLNDGVLDCWAEILTRVPDAQLELGAHLLDDAAAHARTLERFAQRGIAPQRLRLCGQRDYARLLEAYRRADIALDPFPFSGCTTSCDALWMGVPVVALCGTTFVARQSASLLARLGREQWIAHDPHDYVERAVALAREVDALRAARGALRDLTRRQLCDAPAQAREFAALLRGLWIEHCATP